MSPNMAVISRAFPVAQDPVSVLRGLNLGSGMRGGFLDIEPTQQHGTMSSERVSCSTVTALKFLKILSLNLCFARKIR